MRGDDVGRPANNAPAVARNHHAGHGEIAGAQSTRERLQSALCGRGGERLELPRFEDSVPVDGERLEVGVGDRFAGVCHDAESPLCVELFVRLD